MTGTVNEKITATIIPGAMKRMKPRIIRAPEIKPATTSGPSLWIVSLNATRRLASPFSKMSEAYFTAIPLAIILIVHKKTANTDAAPISIPT